MNIEELRNHCLAVKDVEECTPFGEDTMVYKVMNKMFAFSPLNPKKEAVGILGSITKYDKE